MSGDSGSTLLHERTQKLCKVSDGDARPDVLFMTGKRILMSLSVSPEAASWINTDFHFVQSKGR